MYDLARVTVSLSNLLPFALGRQLNLAAPVFNFKQIDVRSSSQNQVNFTATMGSVYSNPSADLNDGVELSGTKSK